jgi:hypothetical protein
VYLKPFIVDVEFNFLQEEPALLTAALDESTLIVKSNIAEENTAIKDFLPPMTRC